MLSLQSLQTLRGASAVQLLPLQPRRGSYMASLLPVLGVLARASGANSLCQSRAAPAFWLGQSVHAPLG